MKRSKHGWPMEEFESFLVMRVWNIEGKIVGLRNREKELNYGEQLSLVCMFNRCFERVEDFWLR